MPIIHVQMAKGRTEHVKQELVEALTREASRILNVDEGNIWITIDEYARENWASGGILHSIKYGEIKDS